MSRKTSRKQSEQMDDFFLQHPKREGGTQHPVSANVRRFQSNQGINNVNNIHADREIQSFDQRNQNIDETKNVDLD